MELPWALGPPDGRYPVRGIGAPPGSDPVNVLVLTTLGAPERHRLAGLRRSAQAQPEPEPAPVATGRATIVDVQEPFADSEQGGAWLQSAGEPELNAGLEVLNRTLHAFRLVTADPHLHTISRHQALVARIGFGAGEQVADGAWTDARELSPTRRRPSRAQLLEPQARLAAVLNGHRRALACEELALRARLDLEQGRDREAALQLGVALDAALAELAR
ncbi:MAG: hypothetical protein ACR2LV_01020, partial [Solirubrobacteraceae bacterium]